MSINPEGKTVVYTKPSSNHGTGPVPVGAEGVVLMYSESPSSKKIVVDFGPYGKAVLPLSSVKVLEGEI